MAFNLLQFVPKFVDKVIDNFSMIINKLMKGCAIESTKIESIYKFTNCEKKNFTIKKNNFQNPVEF
jgi:hypothetical protein